MEATLIHVHGLSYLGSCILGAVHQPLFIMFRETRFESVLSYGLRAVSRYLLQAVVYGNAPLISQRSTDFHLLSHLLVIFDSYTSLFIFLLELFHPYILRVPPTSQCIR